MKLATRLPPQPTPPKPHIADRPEDPRGAGHKANANCVDNGLKQNSDFQTYRPEGDPWEVGLMRETLSPESAGLPGWLCTRMITLSGLVETGARQMRETLSLRFVRVPNHRVESRQMTERLRSELTPRGMDQLGLPYRPFTWERMTVRTANALSGLMLWK